MLDANSVLFRSRMHQKRNELKEQEEFYRDEIQRIQEELDALSSDKTRLEKFAREKYFFKREGEEIFIVEEEGK